MKTSSDKLTANLREYCPECKVMVMCNCTEGNTNLRYCVGSSHSQKEILERFQDFFYEPDDVDETDVSDKQLLSEREIEILKTVALGMTNKEIGDKLYISINTVITHRKNITDKLGIKTIAGLTVYALMNNIIKPEEVTQ
ncbi:MAG: helix-turn-helix transcriptional regulator [Marinilabiliaceae bacterium]|nr:helix-turn-helix transcriptional regulator [Marinilabiliaceae bacterium]